MVVTDEPGPTPAKLLDIEMLVMTVGGKERTRGGVRGAVRRFRLPAQPHRADRAPICVIEPRRPRADRSSAGRHGGRSGHADC